MKDPQIVDFNKSSVSWLGESAGIFKLASILSVFCKGSETDTFVLTEHVLAGNVYAKKGLVKKPPYLFQLVASSKYQKILRTDLDSDIPGIPRRILSRKQILDSEGNLFKDNINVDIQHKLGKNINKFYRIKKCLNAFSLNGCLSIHTGHHNFKIEFPIRHLNIEIKKEKWQVETGPILFPVLSDNKKEYSLSPSFLFFGSLNKADVFLDYPLKRRIFPQHKDNVVADLKCNISLFREQ